MEFKEWFLKNEVAKARPRNIDISNLAIGRIGPMGTFGQDTGQSIPAWATASALGSMGKSLRKSLGSLGSEPAHQLLPLAMLKDIYRDGMELPLQIPIIDNGTDMVFNIARSSDKLVVASIMSNINGDPLQDPRVRKFGETNPEMRGKFQLVNPNDENQSKVDIAKRFTEGLIKVILLYKMNNTKTATGQPLSNLYDVQNPQVSAKYFSRNSHLAVMLSYKRLANVPDETDNDYTAKEPQQQPSQQQPSQQQNTQAKKGE